MSLQPREKIRTLREGADRVAQVLRDAGHEAYFAGGCVRDALLGLSPKDYDITTNARPEQVAKLFRRTIMVGAAFGVVKVVLGKGLDYEIATYRTDGVYTDGRRPDAISYSETVQEDVQRRDFTINALLMDPRDDQIVDFVDGQTDLKSGLIRAVGDPNVRFAEDRLRMLRAVRFAARFAFKIEPETFTAMCAHAAGLGQVSVERITQELEGIFRSQRPGHGYELLVQTGLLMPALPFFTDADRAVVGAAFLRLPEATRDLDEGQRVVVAWSLLMQHLKPNEWEPAVRTMKLSRDQLRGIKMLLLARAMLVAMPDEEPAQIVACFAGPDASLFASYQEALCGPEAEVVAQANRVRQNLVDSPLPSRPMLSGADLKGLGMQPGRHFKTLLDAVDVEILERRIVSKAEALAFVEKIAK